MFLWRGMSGALAVSECLRNHGLQAEVLCQICHKEPETICHVLFRCEAAKQVWEVAEVSRVDPVFSDSLQDNFEAVFHLLEGNGVSQSLKMALPWLLWGIWKRRNETIYAGQRGDVESLVSHAFSEAAIWNNLMATRAAPNNQRSHNTRVENRWLRPPEGTLKCNIHASWINGTHMCGGAWIVRNHRGDVLFHSRETFLPASNHIAAELRCVIWALECLKDLHLDIIEISSDSSPSIEAIIDHSNWPRYHSLTSRIHNLMPRFQKVFFQASSTKANRTVREIAKNVTRDGHFQSYLARGGPAWLHNLIDEDNRRSL